MQFDRTEILYNKTKGTWEARVYYKDKHDYYAYVDLTGYKSEFQAKWHAGKKRKEIDNNGGMML